MHYLHILLLLSVNNVLVFRIKGFGLIYSLFHVCRSVKREFHIFLFLCCKGLIYKSILLLNKGVVTFSSFREFYLAQQ